MTIIVPPDVTTVTLGELRDRMQAYGYGTDTAGAQNVQLNSVYRRVCGMRNWWFLEEVGNTDLTLEVNTDRVDTTDLGDFLSPIAVRLETPTDHFDLDFLRHQIFRVLAHRDRTPQRPEAWTRVNTDILFYPAAGAEYTVVLDYYKAAQQLQNDGDTIAIPDAYADVVVWGAIKEMCFRQRDSEGAALANEEYLALLAQMRHRDGLEQRQTPSQVVASGDVERVNHAYG